MRTVIHTGLTLSLMMLLGTPLDAAEHTRDSPATVQKTVASGQAVLVDVREQSEWDDGHIQGAVLLPLSLLEDNVTVAQLSARQIGKEKVLYLHCGSGRRCLKAAAVLEKMGYQVQPLKPGYRDLLRAGFPAAK
ncbi:MAG: rhodanese-like domain-containing protein [Bacteroidales bacterium]|nr:rhodanese-like domain-containing protein [Bacteroidales bacterium]